MSDPADRDDPKLAASAGSGDAGPTKPRVTWKGIVEGDEKPSRVEAVAKSLRPGGSGGSGGPGGSSRSGDDGMRRRRRRSLLIGGLVVVVIGLVLASAHIVSAGSVSVPITFGSAQTPIGEGLHFTAPWPITVTNDLSVRTQNYTMTAADIPDTDDPVLVLGLDGASATVQATLLFNLEPARASDVFRDVGPDYAAKLVQPSARSCIRTEFAGYDMVLAATGSLGDVSAKVRQCIADKIEPVGIRLQDLQIREVTLGDQVQTAINAKVSAQQDAERKLFELQQAQVQADITRQNADATADAQQILACGAAFEEEVRDGQTIQVIVPNPPDRCNPAQLSPEVLQYNYIQMLREVLATNANNTVIVNGSGGDGVTPLVNVSPTTAAP